MEKRKNYNEINIQHLSTSTTNGSYLLLCKGQYYEANHSIVELLKILQEETDTDKAIRSYIEQTKGIYTEEQIKKVLTHYIDPILLSSPSHTKKVFLYQKEILTADKIDMISDYLGFLFKKSILCLFISLNLFLNFYFLVTTKSLLQFNNHVNAYTIIGLLLFVVASSFFHEIGHASACKYFGIKHGGIGFGLYLNFPVLYTDVTEIWKLKRQQRCIVNIAGVYFQMFWQSALLIIFFATENDIIRYMILTMTFGFLMTLNPFFKFDGYWIVSDLLGVPNLKKRATELLSYLYHLISRKPTMKKTYLLKIGSLEKYCFLIYSLLVNIFMGYYFFYIIPKFIYKFVEIIPKEINALIFYLSNNRTPPLSLLWNLFTEFIFLAFIIIFIINLIKKINPHGTKAKI